MDSKLSKEEIMERLIEVSVIDKPEDLNTFKKYTLTVKPRFEEIIEWLRSGDTRKIIIEKLGLCKNQFYKYKNVFPEFNYVLQEGTIANEEEMEETLYRLAKGGIKVKKQQINPVTGDIVTLENELSPNFSALKFGLGVSNREKFTLTDKSEVKVSGDSQLLKNVISELTTEEIREFLSKK